MTMDNKAINNIRVLSAEAIQAANSGHPGLPLGAAPMAYTLWAREMKHNPKNPKWVDRDRFVLSAGHGSMLQYSLLHLFGYGLEMEEIKNFRQWGSKTAGHPEFGHTVGVEISTGPLGQGIANAVGFAMAEANLAATYNRPEMEIVNHYTYALAGDGCMMEGISYEAASLAGTYGLGKLIVLYDSNDISIEGSTDIAFTENVAKRFEAMNWQVLRVEDGNDIEAIQAAIQEAKKDTERPTMIEVRTVIGFGSPKAGTSGVHGSPLGEENIPVLKQNLGWEHEEQFIVPADVQSHMDAIIANLGTEEDAWNQLYADYKAEHPELAKQFEDAIHGELPMDYLNSDDFWNYRETTASRASSGKVLNKIADRLPSLFGGSADLAPSTKTIMDNRSDFKKGNYEGSNLRFGVREHAMAAIANGIEAHGGLRGYVSTFFVFSDYMKPSMRLAAMMKLPVTYVLTHDSIGVGEDGPTHQPIDQLAMLRAIPNLNVIRPADSVEVTAAWYQAVTSKETPTVLVLSRQNLPALDNSSKEALKGGYVLVKEDKAQADAVLMATGSEVSVAVEAQKMLLAEGIDVRVVSMPCVDLFEQQSEEYKQEVFGGVDRSKRVAMEAAASLGWYKYAANVIARDDFGASAPANILFKEFGLTAEDFVKKVKEILS